MPTPNGISPVAGHNSWSTYRPAILETENSGSHPDTSIHNLWYTEGSEQSSVNSAYSCKGGRVKENALLNGIRSGSGHRLYVRRPNGN